MCRPLRLFFAGFDFCWLFVAVCVSFSEMGVGDDACYTSEGGGMARSVLVVRTCAVVQNTPVMNTTVRAVDALYCIFLYIIL